MRKITIWFISILLVIGMFMDLAIIIGEPSETMSMTFTILIKLAAIALFGGSIWFIKHCIKKYKVSKYQSIKGILEEALEDWIKYKSTINSKSDIFKHRKYAFEHGLCNYFGRNYYSINIVQDLIEVFVVKGQYYKGIAGCASYDTLPDIHKAIDTRIELLNKMIKYIS